MAELYGKFTFEILDRSGRVLADLSSFARERKLDFVRNNTYAASFTLPLYKFEKYCRDVNIHPRSLLGIGVNTLQVKRLGTRIYTGVISNLSSSFEDQPSIEVKAVGWLEVFKYRFTAQLDQHTGETYGTIMWNDINTSQLLTNGSWGITRGFDDTVDSRDKKHEDKNIKDAITDITKLEDGPDIEFTSDKAFNTFANGMGSQRDEFQFTFPGNIKKFSLSTDSTAMANSVLTRGQGIGAAQLRDPEEDTDSEASYRLRQFILDKNDVSEIATLQQAGLEYLRTHSSPIEILAVTLEGTKSPTFGAYWLGDRVKNTIVDLQYFDQINDYYKIDEIHLDIGDNDSEDVDLKLTL